MEHLNFEMRAEKGKPVPPKGFSLAGVVASGNLEVMMEGEEKDGACAFSIDTSAKGFADSWRAVVSDFMARHKPSNLRVSINDNAASPAVVSLRLDQAYEALMGGRSA